MGVLGQGSRQTYIKIVKIPNENESASQSIQKVNCLRDVVMTQLGHETIVARKIHKERIDPKIPVAKRRHLTLRNLL